MDWRLKLFQILDAISEEEGYLFERSWPRNGVTPEECKQILAEYETREGRWITEVG